MRAIRDIQTGWLAAWWDPVDSPQAMEPEPEEGQELIEIDITVEEFEAELKREAGLDEIAGAYIEENGKNSQPASQAADAGRDGLREIPPGRLRQRAEPPAAPRIDDTWPVLSVLKEYGARVRKRDNQPITYGDLKEIVRLIESGEIGGADD